MGLYTYCRARFFLFAVRYGSDRIRESAAFALSSIGDPNAVNALTAALRDSDSSIRSAAVETLAKTIERWRVAYNETTTHAALRMSTPKAFAAARPFERTRQMAPASELSGASPPEPLAALKLPGFPGVRLLRVLCCHRRGLEGCVAAAEAFIQAAGRTGPNGNISPFLAETGRSVTARFRCIIL